MAELENEILLKQVIGAREPQVREMFALRIAAFSVSFFAGSTASAASPSQPRIAAKISFSQFSPRGMSSQSIHTSRLRAASALFSRLTSAGALWRRSSNRNARVCRISPG